MEQPRDRRAVRQVVVDPDRLSRLGYLRRDGPRGQELQRARIDLQPPVHAPGQDDHLGAVCQKFLYVNGLDTR